MPKKKTAAKAKKKLNEGKAPSTAAGEFVKEEMDHIREGEHGARSTKQAIAIGLSKARRAGVPLPPPKEGTVSEKTAKATKAESEKGLKPEPKSRKRAMASKKALKKEPRKAASKTALSRHAKKVARKKTTSERSGAAKKAVRTKGPKNRSAAAKKAARTRKKT